MDKKIVQQIEVKKGDRLIFRTAAGHSFVFQFHSVRHASVSRETDAQAINWMGRCTDPPFAYRSTVEVTLVGSMSDIEVPIVTHYRVLYCGMISLVPAGMVERLGNGYATIRVSDTMKFTVHCSQIQPCTSTGELI